MLAPAPDGEIGEMLIRSPGTTPEYWLDPGRIEPLPDGWFHSGDLLRREPDGQVRYITRQKDLNVRGGSNISPAEVEDVLRCQSGIMNVAVVGLPDPNLGQRIGAAVVLAADAPPTTVKDALVGARDALADYKVPETVKVLKEIPRNALTKIDRDKIMRELQCT